ncbi:hypothetical protein FHS89_000604 [Rubricella aquisinus]|uniref:Cardiolipin synthase N-terminal domain-containing protein n=1 Tax=Rubricella aquisinus TaxID=2028108 RepID=A0A840WY57_9RHOB|nr:PLDc N-terminal domain-containing protein [Rubricella aquisinus]MBB5514606.1 hypothetical protein [Rubricella aquisinus]
MGLELGLLGIIGLALMIWAIISVFNSAASTGAKVLWIVGILVFPFVGFILWLFLGPRSAK